MASPSTAVDAAHTAPTDASLVLRVSGFPSALSGDAVTALLSHYGATRVRVLRRKKPGAVLHGVADQSNHVAIAAFASRERRQDAQQRLARVQLAGSRLTVVVASGSEDKHVENASHQETSEPNAHDEESPTRAMNGKAPTNSVARREHSQLPTANMPAPLAPHLGLHYASSPLLHYKYPKATVPIVRNIANALIALPRFYTQVLHLMNKMNLPPPFDSDAIPGRFSEQFMPELRNRGQESRTQPQFTDQLVEEDEDDDDDQDMASKTQSNAARTGASQPRALTNERASSIGKKRPRSEISSSSLTTYARDATERDNFHPPRPGVISSAELDRQRIPVEAHAREPAFKGYTNGTPSCRVRVENLAESVDKRDLAYVFGYVVPLDTPLESLQIQLNASTYSAVVLFPTLECATQAIEQINGVVLAGQPLVVRYDAASQSPPAIDTNDASPNPVSQPSGSGDVKMWERMDATQLAQEKAMKNYQRGDPTAALYLKNLAKTVDEDLLRSLCRSTDTSTASLTIRHFTEGRMKNQAFIEFPNTDAATRVLESIHGLVVHGKPLIVSYRKTQTS